jgi:lathosterol oxidase
MKKRDVGSAFLTDEPHAFGSGWISGTIGAVLGIAGMCGAACLLEPSLFVTPEVRAIAPEGMRLVVVVTIALASALGVVSLCLRKKKTLGLVALIASALGAALLAFVREGAPADGVAADAPWLALDAFALNLLLYTAAFVPLERICARLPQPTFRPEWQTDLAWFASSALFVQFTTFVVLAPGNALSAMFPAAAEWTAPLPLLVQFCAIVLCADLVQYWIHRACHRVPFLWRFHAVHHSAEAMDWLAGSRLHLVDALLTRALVFAAIAVLGFDLRAVAAYLVFVGAQATFVHCNVGWRMAWLERFLVTPRFHHWHHAAELRDVNFAVHLPWLDRLFGTWRMPDGWPRSYGLADGAKGWRGFVRQMVGPFVGGPS